MSSHISLNTNFSQLNMSSNNRSLGFTYRYLYSILSLFFCLDSPVSLWVARVGCIHLCLVIWNLDHHFWEVWVVLEPLLREFCLFHNNLTLILIKWIQLTFPLYRVYFFKPILIFSLNAFQLADRLLDINLVLFRNQLKNFIPLGLLSVSQRSENLFVRIIAVFLE